MIATLLMAAMLAGFTAAQKPSVPASPEDIDALARQVAGEKGTSVERTQRLVTWMNTNFDWTATDYEQRTAEQIIARRGGNCAELSRVLARLLRPARVRYRWISEINIHPDSPRRQETAARMVQEKGPRFSVFGLRHNDHRWLEIYDEVSQHWVPADPSIGVVGIGPWIQFRMGLVKRPAPAVPAVASIVEQMIVPFAVMVRSECTSEVEDRSELYLIEEFNRAYDGRLASLPAWKDWTRGVRELAPLSAGAFQGTVNLHEHVEEIARLAEAYLALRQQAEAAGLH